MPNLTILPFPRPSSRPRPSGAKGSAEVNAVISYYLQHGHAPAAVGSLDPVLVVDVWRYHAEPIQDGWVIFDMSWLTPLGEVAR
jgi:hypothetical protein